MSDTLITQLYNKTFGDDIHSLLQNRFDLIEKHLAEGLTVDYASLKTIAFALFSLKSYDPMFFEWFSRSVQLLESAKKDASIEGYDVEDFRILKSSYLLMGKRYSEAEAEYISLIKSLGFDRREGKLLTVLDTKGDSTVAYLIAVIQMTTLGLKLAFYTDATNCESYTLIIRLLEELSRFSSEGKLRVVQESLVVYLEKCTLLLVHKVLCSEHDLVCQLHSYTIRAQEKLRASSIEFSEQLCSFLFSEDLLPHSEPDRACIHKVLVHVIESLSKLGNRENRGVDLVEFIYSFTNSCKHATTDLRKAVVTSVKDILAWFPDKFALEKATVLYNLSWYSLQLCQSDHTKNYNTLIQEVVLWLKQAFVLSGKDPSLLQKVSTLLSCIYIISCSVEPFDSWLSFSKLTANQWAFYFHTRSVGCCFSSQFSSKLATKGLTHHPESVDLLDNVVLNFFEEIPDMAIVVSSFLSSAFVCLKTIMPKDVIDPEVVTWQLLSRVDSERNPIVALLPVKLIIIPEVPSLLKANIQMRHKWMSKVMIQVIPGFQRLIDESLIYNFPVERTGRSTAIWRKSRKLKDAQLKEMISALQDLLGISTSIFKRPCSECRIIFDESNCFRQGAGNSENRCFVGLVPKQNSEVVDEIQESQPIVLVVDTDIEDTEVHPLNIISAVLLLLLFRWHVFL